MTRSLSRLHLVSLFTFVCVGSCSSDDASVRGGAGGGASGSGGGGGAAASSGSAGAAGIAGIAGTAGIAGAAGSSGGSGSSGSSGSAAAAGASGSGGSAGSSVMGGAAGTSGTGGAAGSSAAAGASGSGGGAGSGGSAGSGGTAGSGGAAGKGGAAGAGGSSGSSGTGGTAGAGGSSGVVDSGPGMDVNPPVSGVVVPLDIPKEGIVALMKRAADWGHANINTYSHNMTTGNDWATGAFYTGITAVWRTTKEATYRDWVIQWGNNNQWKPNSIGNPDDMACMQTFCEAYILEPNAGNEGRYTPSKTLMDPQLAKNPSGSGWFWWEDGLYMGPPVISMLGAITGQTSYFDQVTRIWFEATGAYCQQDTQLCFWKKEWIYPAFKTSAGNPALWGPGNAWVIGGMIRSMKYLPQSYANRQKWITSFQTMCNSLRTRQQPEGAWRTNLYEPTEFPDPESSSTSFFTYAMALGMLYGWLDQPTYMPVVKKSWAWLTTVIDANGKVGRCQPWSNQPGGAGAGNNTPEGQGAFMLAGEGMYLLATR